MHRIAFAASASPHCLLRTKIAESQSSSLSFLLAQALNPRSRITSSKKSEGDGSGAEADQELMSSMMRRLAAAERELNLKSQQLLRVKGERDGLLDKVTKWPETTAVPSSHSEGSFPEASNR